MKYKLPYRIINDPKRVLLLLLLVEWMVMVFTGFDFMTISGPPLYSIPFDPVYIFIFGMKIPQVLTSSKVLACLFELSVLIGLIWMVFYPQSRIASLLLLMMVIQYVGMTGYLGHRNFQTGFLIVLFPFLFRKEANWQFALEIVRYFILFFYFSAGLFKLMESGWLNITHMSDVINRQMIPFNQLHGTGLRWSMNSWLINHAWFSQGLFWSGMIIELAVLVGFFTKQYDKLIGYSLLFLHLANWWIMDISAIGQISLIALLIWFGSVQEKKY